MNLDRPAFIDPVPEISGGEVGEAPAPRWFTLVAGLVLAASLAYLAGQISGPKLSWRHDFESGRGGTESTTH